MNTVVDRDIINKFAAIKKLNVRDTIGGIDVQCINDSKEFREARINEVKKLCDLLNYRYVVNYSSCLPVGSNESTVTILSGCTSILMYGPRKGELCNRTCILGSNLCSLCRTKSNVIDILYDKDPARIKTCINDCDMNNAKCQNYAVFGGYCLTCLSMQ